MTRGIEYIVLAVAICLSTMAEAAPQFGSLFGGSGGAPCMFKCVSKLKDGGASVGVSFSKGTDFTKQLLKVEETCKKIDEARQCMEGCDSPINPFDMSAMKYMCSEETKLEMQKHSGCYEAHGEKVENRCNEECGTTEELDELGAQGGNGVSFGRIFKNMDKVCNVSRCQSKCSRDQFTELCKNSDPEAGKFLETFSVKTLTAMAEDMNEFGMGKVMERMLPKECRFFFRPEQMFMSEQELSDLPKESSEEDESSETGGLSSILSRMFSTLSESGEDGSLAFPGFGGPERRVSKISSVGIRPFSLRNINSGAHGREDLLALKRRVLEKQERNLDRELQKLDMEIEQMKKKSET